MAYRDRNRFRPRNDEEDFNYNLHHSAGGGSDRDYPLTDADRERFAREDFTRDDDRDRDVDRYRYGRDSFETHRAYSRFNEPRPSSWSSRTSAGGRDWRDTFYPRGTMGDARDSFSGGGYTDDVGGSGMMNALRSNRGRGQTEYWEPHIDNARPFFTGAHSNQVPERDSTFGGAGHAGDHLYDNHRHDREYLQWRHNQLTTHDRDYHNWRAEQARNYDASYEKWCRSRTDKFAKEFNDWRSSQDSLGQTSDLNASPGADITSSANAATRATNAAASTGAAYGAGADRTGQGASTPQSRTASAGANPPVTGAAPGSSGSGHSPTR